MLTTKELIAWAMKAENMRESSWNEISNSYEYSYNTAVSLTRPLKVSNVEREIVLCMIEHFWNEIQIWYAQLCK